MKTGQRIYLACTVRGDRGGVEAGRRLADGLAQRGHMLIALRGHWGEPYPWHTRGGIVTEGVLRALNIPFEYARDPKEVGRQIREAYTFSQSSLSPVALLLTRDLMEEAL